MCPAWFLLGLSRKSHQYSHYSRYSRYKACQYDVQNRGGGESEQPADPKPTDQERNDIAESISFLLHIRFSSLLGQGNGKRLHSEQFRPRLLDSTLAFDLVLTGYGASGDC